MKKVVHKWFMDWMKEEKWLNEMASKGLVLSSVGIGRYEFEESLPGEYAVKMELLDKMPDHPESEQYIRFVEETGAEHVTSYLRWVYFRKKTVDGTFELYSDCESKIKHMNRILVLLGTLGGMNILIGAYNIFLALIFDSGVNWMGIINLGVGILIGLIFVRNYLIKRKLVAEKQIYQG